MNHILSVAGRIWERRRLVLELARRELRARYAGSALGLAWAVAEPAVQLALYLTVFSYVLGIRLEGRSDVASFGLYLVSGLVPFLFIQEVVGLAASLLRANAPLMRHVALPAEALLAATLLAVLARFAVAMTLVLAVGVATGSTALANLAWLPFSLVLLALAAFATGLLVMVVGAFLPDIGHVIGTAMSVVFYLTPIVYPLSMVPAPWRGWFIANPLAPILDGFRRAVMGLPPPQPPALAVSVAFTLVVLAAAAALLDARRRMLPDVL